MKKILIVSDTHSFWDPRLNEALDACDEVWHAGDWGSEQIADYIIAKGKIVRGVYGNIDGAILRRMYTKILKFQVEGLVVGMTHIAGAPSSYKPDAIETFSKGAVDIFICGHSHILQIKRDLKRNNMLFINPGAAGQHGFHPVQTAVQLKIDQKRIFDVEVIQMERKKS
ncbi:metallophosphoesterase [Sandaracinomonas limnophila]|uniref:Metallophosphoesterase n=1 Tax=Sandaracinomonas limnophila TaxID=1862386 RepID=A0A437PXD5_9BACT|nr:metallophosphoesterase family protein [Sandaracinomonas limnophila]RVU26911.1 metallophosphoesterase [Sandaracinomonas limnophila]